MNSEFSQPSDEIKRVAEEINLLRRDIQQISGSLSRIERRLKAAFTNYPVKTKLEKTRGLKHANRSSLTPDQLQDIFNEIVAATQADGDNGFQRRISDVTDSDVIALAVEIGMGTPSSLNRSKAVTSIRKRVQEAMQLQYREKKTI